MSGEDLTKKLYERRAQINNDAGIREVENLIKKEDRFCGKYFVSDTFEFLELGIISKNTKAGKEMLEKMRML